MKQPSKPSLPDTLPDPNTAAARVARSRLWRRRVAAAAVAGFGLALTGLLTLAGLFAYYGRDLPDVHALRSRWNPPQTTRVLARDGSVLAELFIERRTVVPLANLPENLVKALLAAEDAEFYAHRGLDWPGMVRALWVNVRRGTVAQGASTITQQVVKNVLLNSERSLARKVREVLLARRIESELGKNEILFLYVNHIAFGHGRNGVEEAARFYFGKHVGELTLGECVLLAGIPKSPVHYSPRNDLEAALRRRRWILGQMVANSFITQSQADMAAAEPVHLATTPEDEGTGAPEVVEIARRALAQAAGDDALRRGGYTVHTTIDPQLQRAAREAVVHGLQQLDARHGYRGPLVLPGARRPAASGNVVRAEAPPRDGRLHPGHIYAGVVSAAEDGAPGTRQRGALVVRVGDATGRVPWETAARYANGLAPSQFAPVGAAVRVSPDQLITPEAVGTMRLELGPQGAMVAIDPASRELLAVVGAFDAVPGLLNRATRAERQPGSAFKPFLYSFATTSRRFTAASVVDPNPGCFGAGRGRWCPAEAHAHEGVVEPPMRLREALAASRNMVAARLMEALGPDAVATHARALGLRLETTRPFDLTLALGSSTVTPVELVNAYATWASGGRAEEWFVIRRIVAPDGRSLPLPARPPPRQVMTPAEAYVVTSMLTSVIDHGTARSARALNRPAAGKTGTTDRARDAWFVGYTTDMVAGVWVGFDDRQPLGSGEEGARAAVPVWTQFMREYVRARRPPAIEFPRPQGVVTARIDALTGMLAPPPVPGVVEPAGASLEEVFLEGTEPHEVAVPDGAVATDAAAVDDGAAPVSGEAPLVLTVEEAPAEDAGAVSDAASVEAPDAAVGATGDVAPDA
ncbi:MAG: PBP1A family penicillin-binding protein [Polyangiales bacterium]